MGCNITYYPTTISICMVLLTFGGQFVHTSFGRGQPEYQRAFQMRRMGLHNKQAPFHGFYNGQSLLPKRYGPRNNGFHAGRRHQGRLETHQVRNPYFHVITRQEKYEWSIEDGWHAVRTDDEYHSPTEEPEQVPYEESHETASTEWRGEGSFTGDLRLSCLGRTSGNRCAYGIVEMHHKELDTWGLICADTWNQATTTVVCNYLNFRKGRSVKLNKSKAPGEFAFAPHFLRNLECTGDEYTLTDCMGEPVRRNYTCNKNRIAAVRCSGEKPVAEVECEASEMKCTTGDRCIDQSYVCDGMSDCPWASDEEGCDAANCKNDEFWCGPSGGGCMLDSYRCDGESDCIDESDEMDCDSFLSTFTHVTGRKLRIKRYEATWENTNPYICAKICLGERSFPCTSFDFNKNKNTCHLTSASATTNLKTARNWDHYEREHQEDCDAVGKYRCNDGECIFFDDVCNTRDDCSAGGEEKECEPLLARLRGGEASYEGRVEVSKGLKYGLVCDDHWTMNEANVVCRQLGYSRGARMALKGGSFGGSGRNYVLENVRCTGYEMNLENCRHGRWSKSSCKIDHEAGVVCMTDETTTRPITAVTQRPSTPTPTPGITAANRECGNKPPEPDQSRPQARVVGGSGAEPHEWPWQVGIWLPWTYWCGGSLIDACWVLTAAHCFEREYNLNHYTLRLGDHVAGTDEGTEQEFKIERIIKHDYNDSTKDNDIALIKLKPKNGRCAQLTDEVRLICLPKTQRQFGEKTVCHISGWGKISVKDAMPYTPILQEAPTPLISDRKCEDESEYSGILTKNMMCAGYLAGGIDTCQGDSGGPLSCKDKADGKYYVWGVVSWGNGCARPRAPGVYTRVGNYLSWIARSTGLRL